MPKSRTVLKLSSDEKNYLEELIKKPTIEVRGYALYTFKRSLPCNKLGQAQICCHELEKVRNSEMEWRRTSLFSLHFSAAFKNLCLISSVIKTLTPILTCRIGVFGQSEGQMKICP